MPKNLSRSRSSSCPFNEEEEEEESKVIYSEDDREIEAIPGDFTQRIIISENDMQLMKCN